jgi:uncharacterized protein involved in tolerance to divalent cations
MEKAADIRIVYVTTKYFDNAQQIAKIIVTEHLAACCSIIQNVFSTFGWQGVIQERHEFLMMIKTTSDRLDELEKRIIELHQDDVPEIISVPVESASAPYLSWLKESVV